MFNAELWMPLIGAWLVMIFLLLTNKENHILDLFSLD
jgi:hypothetical protein